MVFNKKSLLYRVIKQAFLFGDFNEKSKTDAHATLLSLNSAISLISFDFLALPIPYVFAGTRLLPNLILKLNHIE